MFEPNSQFAATIRSTLLLIAGIFIIKGKNDAASFLGQYTDTIIAVILGFGSFGWSLMDKARAEKQKAKELDEAARLAEKQIAVAVQMPATATVDDVKFETMKQEIAPATEGERTTKEI